MRESAALLAKASSCHLMWSITILKGKPGIPLFLFIGGLVSSAYARLGKVIDAVTLESSQYETNDDVRNYRASVVKKLTR
jgi:hypothetical protein